MTTDQSSAGEFAELAELMRVADEDPEHGAQIVPERRRTRRRRALAIVSIVLAIVLVASGSYVIWALTAPLSAPDAAFQTPQVPAPSGATISVPSAGASAISIAGADDYLGADASGVWTSSGTDEPVSIASISKLITALVVLDAKPLADAADPGPTITFSKADHDLYDEYYVLGASIAAMPTGSSMSLRDALATMLIPSASNYAEAVSTWAFGSQGAFLSAARAWLAANGLSGTTLVEPTGIDSRNTSTRTDVMALARLAAADPTIAAIAATPSLSLPGPGAMSNTNDLLGTDGITGLKTGNLGEGTYSLLYTASLDVGAAEPLDITGVVLHGFSRQTVNGDVLRLLGSIRDGFHTVPVATAGEEVGSLSTAWGSTARVVVAEDASIFTWSDTPITVTMSTATPTTYADGEVIGSLTWTAGPNSVTVDVRIEGSIDEPTDWWRLTHPMELGGQ